jgi:MiaB-like tRNA modifying enzyme
MLNRIKKLNALAEKNGAEMIVAGCLPAMNRKEILNISESIVLLGTNLEELAEHLELKKQSYSPCLEQLASNKFVSIIPVSTGCLSACSFCGTKIARGNLKSFPVKEINERFRKELAHKKEIWITSQDNGCYGFDIGTSIAVLLKELLSNSGKFRIRLGMANPQYLEEYFNELMQLFEDERMYRFLHLPVQSGSNRILKAMKRNYSAEYYESLVKKIRFHFPDMAFSTDVIVGFPGEKEKDFQKTVELLSRTKPDVVNISMYGQRPFTPASKMPGQLHGREKKRRSRILTKLCSTISLENNKKLAGKELKVLVTEKGSRGGFVGRANNYKPVVIEKDLRGEFVRVRVEKAFPTHLKAVLL